MDFSEMRTIFGEMILFTNHAWIFGLSFRFTLIIIFLCLRAQLLIRVFIFVIVVTIVFSKEFCGFLGASNYTELTLEVWKGVFIRVLVWKNELGLVDLFNGFCCPFI